MKVSIRGEGKGIEVTYVPNESEVNVLKHLFEFKSFSYNVNVEPAHEWITAINELKLNGFVQNVSNSLYSRVWVLTDLGKALLAHLNQGASK